ncbi:hypothetical protein LSCM1_02183 [Leishmania martiniquensis]|uniref:3'-5' exonuclease n=1 Tax=Leishmania martiniquensis TaxID=1580590 RepID=A0A836FS54_9TRYP|nr:hypothetical protein LSCM1_02183 [Leishmania martiniquensis]
MKSITSSVVVPRFCGVVVDSTADWKSHGERMWAEMMQILRQQPAHLRIMGIDSEWFCNSPLSVVQFATSSHCFVIHIKFLDGRVLPDAVKEVLFDPGIIKCGVGVEGDVSRLRQEQNITVQCVLDIARYSALLGLLSGPKSNLKSLAESVANVYIKKDKLISCSNWELPLSQSELNYAAEDAVASFCVGQALMLKAAEVYDICSSTFDAAQWLMRTGPLAATELKNLQREMANVKVEKRGRSGPKLNSAGGFKVRVVDENGHFMLECSPKKAQYYLMEKSLAVITQNRNNDPRKASEIRLLCDPKVKTRLCIHHVFGCCGLNGTCPFAHSVSELDADAAALLESSTPSCACCLSTKGLMRHAITPPSFRKFMPCPLQKALDEDYLPICLQCTSILRPYYDEEMKRCYALAENPNTTSLDLQVVAKCCSYARLLLDADKLSMIPMERREELRQFVKENWKSTLFHDFNPGFKIHEPVEQDSAFLKQLGRITPGDVRSKVTMAFLVGSDQEKAHQFNKQWRDFFNTCGMVKKKSNHMSNSDWKAFRTQNRESPGVEAEGALFCEFSNTKEKL